MLVVPFFLISLYVLMGNADNDGDWYSLLASYKAAHSADVVLSDKNICQRSFVIGLFNSLYFFFCYFSY